MTIMINQSEVTAVEQLPDKVQTLIQLIPESKNAFDLLLSNQDENFSFNSADSLIEQLALGIRNSSLVLIPSVKLVADIKKLLNLSTNDLRDLSYAVSDSVQKPDPVKPTQLLKKYHLLDSSDFSTVNNFIKRNNLSDASLIWSASFQDQITLQRTLTYCEKAFSCSNAQTKSACKWALSKAQNLSEFAHYYCIYLAWQQYLSKKVDPIDTLMAQLQPVVLSHLKCPTVTFELDANTLNHAIVQWHEIGNTIGFNSATTGLLNIILNIDLSDSCELITQAHQYIARLQKLLAQTLASEHFVNQAGLAQYYVFELEQRSVVMSVAADGCLSIVSDKPLKSVITSPTNTPKGEA
ncbi:hypothetical protein PCIT_b1184 [Pseudoalteromonas citrea]|uniref:Uncharacterized protein n=2 Tax=Pseudoalteromonas citrea TaxID=43655 RepID=A0AAD4AFM2_9GAMM|nr:hypothetical protein [Pseudoalteromonas citrea]KAF7765050.1 hypothetical protein PCIT_b1184 [Pseudoalteromonas citrea]